MQRVLMLVALAACGRSSSSAAPRPAPPVTPAAPARAAPAAGDIDRAVADANALVPAALRSQLRFEKRTLTVRGQTFELPAPAGWGPDPDGAEGKLDRADEPKHDGPPYFPASITVRPAACDGEWTGTACSGAPAADEVEHGLMAGFAGSDTKVLSDDKRPTEREAKAADGFATYALRAWWKPGATRFTYCVATLTDPLRPAVDAFAAACRAVQAR